MSKKTKAGLLKKAGKIRWGDYRGIKEYVEDIWSAGDGWDVIGELLCGEDSTKFDPQFPGCTRTQLQSKMRAWGFTPVTGKGTNDSSDFSIAKITGRKRKRGEGDGDEFEPSQKRRKDNNGGRKDVHHQINKILDVLYVSIPKRKGTRLSTVLKGTDENGVVSVSYTRRNFLTSDFHDVFATKRRTKTEEKKEFGQTIDKLFENNGIENFEDEYKEAVRKNDSKGVKEFRYKGMIPDSFDWQIPCPVELNKRKFGNPGQAFLGMTFPLKRRKKKKKEDRKRFYSESDNDDSD